MTKGSNNPPTSFLLVDHYFPLFFLFSHFWSSFRALRHDIALSAISAMSSIRALFSSWVSLLGVKHTPLPLLEFPEKNTLAGLPTELLWLIADFLSWNDRSCLSLCNRQLFAIYHCRNGSGPPSKSEKLSFLICLERDTPAFFACHVCHILHKYHPSKDYGRTFFDYDSDHALPCAFKWDGRRNGSLTMDPENDTCSSSPYRICFFHLQLAMKSFFLWSAVWYQHKIPIVHLRTSRTWRAS